MSQSLRLRRDEVTAVFVDLHEGAIAAVRTADGPSLRGGVKRLAELVAFFELPAVFAGLAGPAPAFAVDLFASLPAASAPTVRTTAGAFDDPGLQGELAAAGRRTLLLSGVATEGAVVLTALGALEAGYRVAVVVDACGGLDARGEEAALRRLVAAGVVLTSTWTLAAEVQHDFAKPGGAGLLGLLSKYVALG